METCVDSIRKYINIYVEDKRLLKKCIKFIDQIDPESKVYLYLSEDNSSAEFIFYGIVHVIIENGTEYTIFKSTDQTYYTFQSYNEMFEKYLEIIKT